MVMIQTVVVYSKTVLWFSPMHKEGNKLCIIYLLLYCCYHGPLVRALGLCVLLLQSALPNNILSI